MSVFGSDLLGDLISLYDRMHFDVIQNICHLGVTLLGIPLLCNSTYLIFSQRAIVEDAFPEKSLKNLIPFFSWLLKMLVLILPK